MIEQNRKRLGKPVVVPVLRGRDNGAANGRAPVGGGVRRGSWAARAFQSTATYAAAETSGKNSNALISPTASTFEIGAQRIRHPM